MDTGTRAALNPAVADSQQRRSRKLNTPTTNCNIMKVRMMNKDIHNDSDLNGIDSHGSEAQPGVDAVEMRNRVRLPILVLPLLIMMMLMVIMAQ